MRPRLASIRKPVACAVVFHSVSNARAPSIWIVTTPEAMRSSVWDQVEVLLPVLAAGGKGASTAGGGCIGGGGCSSWEGSVEGAEAPARQGLASRGSKHIQAIRCISLLPFEPRWRDRTRFATRRSIHAAGLKDRSGCLTAR